MHALNVLAAHFSGGAANADDESIKVNRRSGQYYFEDA